MESERDRWIEEREGGPPFVGALLRLCWQQVRAAMHEAVRAEGFTDLAESHFAVFSYPLPDNVRLSDLARRMRMSRQAANYLVGQLEELGYLQRRAAADAERRRIFLTERGWRVAEVIYRSLRQIQEKWAEDVGTEKFGTFMDVLRHLAARESTPAR